MKTVSLDKYNRSRESEIEAAGFIFIIRRPTEMDVARASRDGGMLTVTFAEKFVVGWKKVQESDLINGGDPEPVAFDHDVFTTWLADRPDLWRPIADGVVGSYEQFTQANAERGKA